MKHLLKLGGMTPEEILHILDVADEYKRLHKDGVDPKDLQGKAVALVFAKNSTRTRTSLEVGIYQMGGLGTYLSAGDLQTARGEPVQDTARVLGRYYDAIVCRTYKQTTLDMLAKYSGIPVVSGMTDYAHPLQVLTDLMTVRERKGTLAGLKAGFVGDGYNMANSVIVGCLAVGMTVTIACPKGYRPAADVLMLAKQYGDKFTLTNDPDEAARDADVLFTDVWVSMGMERGRAAPPRLYRLYAGRRPYGAGKAGLHGAAPAARPPRRGDRPRCAGSPRRRNFRRGGEPHLRGKGRAGGAAGGKIRALQ